MREITPRTTRENATATFSLRDAVTPVFRQRRVATLIFLGIFFGSVSCAILLPRKYEAETKILVNRDRVDAVVTPDQDAQAAVQATTAVTEEDLNSEVELLKSRDLLEKVVLVCGLVPEHETAWTRAVRNLNDALHGVRPSEGARIAQAVQALEDQLVVDPLKKSDLIRVAYASRDPLLSARVLQTLMAFYQEKHATVHRPAGTFVFFDQQAGRYKEDLNAAESRLVDFNSKEAIVAPDAQIQLALQNISQLRLELDEDQAHERSAQARADSLNMAIAAEPTRQTTQMKSSDNGQLQAQLESTLLSLQLKLDEMLVKYAPSYPPVEEVESQIANTKEAIARAQEAPVKEVTTDRPPVQDWLATELAKSESDQAQWTSQASATAGAVARYEQTAQEISRKGAIQQDLVRDAKTAEENYLLYVRKREEARISDALDTKRIVNVSIAEAATVPALPTFHLGWLLVGTLFTAGFVGVAGAYAADRIDPSFHTPHELGQFLEVKVLASIPAAKPKDGMARKLIRNIGLRINSELDAFAMSEHSSSNLGAAMPQTGATAEARKYNGHSKEHPQNGAHNRDADGANERREARHHDAIASDEMMRLVQQVFIFPANADAPHAVAFCGVDRGAGCTWVCARIAETLARQVRGRVCILDGNLRSPRLHEHFRLPGHRGFADFMGGSAAVHEFAQRTNTGNLWLIAAGSREGKEPNGALNPARLRDRFAELRGEFDYLLIDTPAMDSYADAVLLSQLMDGIILVVSSRSTRRESARVAKASSRVDPGSAAGRGSE